MKRVTLIVLCLSLAVFEVQAQTSLFAYNSSWKYLDNGTDQGTAWRTTAFNDGAWATGTGKFGYGLSGLQTVVSYGPNANQKYITTYFRKAINIPNPGAFSSFTAGVLRDDGIVVYVNGIEVYRNRMKAGTVTYTTFGQDAEDNATITQFFDIDKSYFVSGNNVIEVEIHQKTLSNSDLGFDMQLSGIGAAIDLTPPFAISINRQNPLNQFTQNVAVTYRATFSEKIQGLDKTDFTLTTTAGTVTGVLPDNAVTAVNGDSLAYDILVNGIQGTGTLRLDLNASGTNVTDTAGNPISGGYTNGETYNIEQSGVPVVTSVTRQLPANENTDTTTVTFRVLFSKKVRGVNAADFTLNTSGGNIRGTLSRIAQEAASTSLVDAVKVVGTDSTTYDVMVRALAGTGTLRLDVKNNNNSIVDVNGNMLFGGFNSGQSYNITVNTTQGFTSIQDINPITMSSSTREIPQSKTWSYDGKWWAVFATNAGTKVYRLDGTNWTDVLTLATSSNSRADCKVVGNLVHILMFRGASTTSYLASIEYDAVNQTYKRWTQRTSNVNIVFEAGAITATLETDATNRLWIASNTTSSILVRYSDAPYTNWSAAIPLASGITSEDICAIAYLPGKVGVCWTNQNAKRFGFKTHLDGNDATTWSADEVPASQSALNVNNGMADNYLNMVAGSDGTVYCAVKTGYDKNGLPAMALLVRRPNNTWDNLYPVTSSKEGNRPIVILNEATAKIKVMYSTHLDNFDNTRSGDILYRESSTASISFGAPITLFAGKGINQCEYTSSTHQTYNPGILILAMLENLTPNTAVGVLATDPTTPPAYTNNPKSPLLPVTQIVESTVGIVDGILKTTGGILVKPNPFSSFATVDFTLAKAGNYTVTLFDNNGKKVKELKQGFTEAGLRNSINIDGTALPHGFYFVTVQSGDLTKTFKLLKR
jgi:hypothetical protein